MSSPLPFQGADVWNAFELSWLNNKGKPQVAAAEFKVPCESPYMIESKSFKLYLNSFNNSAFESLQAVERLLKQDLSKLCGSSVQVKLVPLQHVTEKVIRHLEGICLDELDIECDTYDVNPTFLTTEKDRARETVYSDLFKSNCLITGQPDWGSIQIAYHGKRINHKGLLKYIISFRNHNEFHEQCIERMWTDIMKQCQPEKLLVYARYVRRGGLDINPYRSNYTVHLPNQRLWRQ
ncbi:MAG: NADPH-dependent 7-cyano-7-deazaguanine reductase QueF [Gammaproteobacteria bacterium]|nr:NADPH-dependent 7-cyano-7-deazaguanine reductase QueF [Gammaproteobacteria bacterium]